MNNKMNLLQALTFVLCCFLVAEIASAQATLSTQAGQEQTVFQKALSQQRSIVVTEKEIAYTIPPELKALGPNAHEVIPDHVYLYTFLLRSGQKTVTIWSPQENQFKEFWHPLGPSLRVLDAILSQGKLCVVYQEEGMVYANVITPGAPLNKPGVAWGDSQFREDTDTVSAMVTGSLEQNDLAVEMTYSDTGRSRYRLQKGKWIQEASSPALTEAEKGQKPARQPQTTQARFEALAAQLGFFDLDPFLYNRQELDFAPADPHVGTVYFQLMKQVLDPKIPVTDLAALRRHADPKVRTLALAALFQRNDPHLLPQIVELVGDTAPTFPGYTSLSPRWLQTTGMGPPTQNQTVGAVATAMVNFYLDKAGFNYGVAGSGSNPGFAEYWAQRKDRKFCASWFAVELSRASRETSPTQPQYRADFRAVRKHLDALPAVDRDWTLLYLNDEEGSDVLAIEADLMAAAKRRGADVLLSALHQKIPSDDPDLEGHSGFIRGWILSRASQLLRPDMADDLLNCPEAATQPLWTIAAAQLQPARAREILKAALPRFAGDNDHASLMCALAAIGDARDEELISSWFFTPWTMAGGGDDKQTFFLGALPHQGASRGTRQLVAHLIQDKRFDTAKFHAVEQAAELVNAWSSSPIINIQKLYDSAWMGDENNPKAFAALAPVRDVLRQTSPKWGQ